MHVYEVCVCGGYKCKCVCVRREGCGCVPANVQNLHTFALLDQKT